MSVRTLVASVRRMHLSRIGRRLLAFNLLVVFLPVAGILYLDVYERELLQTQERGMVQQARLVAAALGSDDSVAGDEAMALLRRLGRRGDSRIRVYDVRGTLLADSLDVPVERQERNAAVDGRSSGGGVRQRLLYRLGAWLVQARVAGNRLAEVILTPAPEERNPPVVRTETPPEVQAALRGRYGAATRPTPGQRSLSLNSAVPLRSNGQVVGAVLVSQSTYRILGALYAVRLRVFQIVVASLLAAALITIVLSASIVRPLVRLRHAASVLGDGLSPVAVTFPGTARRDEIGDLARALEELTRRLDAHVRLLESFAADVAHEFKNPLASIRTAAEMLADAPRDSDRRRFAAMLNRDVDRLERLVSGVRELARIDAQLAHEDVAPVDVGALVHDIVSGLRLTTACPIELRVTGPETSLPVVASHERLAQVLENLLGNACSFAPPGTAVTVLVGEVDGQCRIAVEDLGPGVPTEHLGRIFDRFFTYRPAETPGRRDHAGLGLAIARAIAEGYGGSITAANRPDGGARFEVRLPVAGSTSSSPGRADLQFRRKIS